jgi:hypothetical protein
MITFSLFFSKKVNEMVKQITETEYKEMDLSCYKEIQDIFESDRQSEDLKQFILGLTWKQTIDLLKWKIDEMKNSMKMPHSKFVSKENYTNREYARELLVIMGDLVRSEPNANNFFGKLAYKFLKFDVEMKKAGDGK